MHTWDLKLTFLSSSIQFKNLRTLYPNHPYHCTFYCFPVFYSILTLNPGWMLLWLFSIAPIYGDLNLLISLLTIPLCIAAFLSALFPSFLEYTPLVNDSKKQIVLVLIFWKVLSSFFKVKPDKGPVNNFFSFNIWMILCYHLLIYIAVLKMSTFSQIVFCM